MPGEIVVMSEATIKTLVEGGVAMAVVLMFIVLIVTSGLFLRVMMPVWKKNADEMRQQTRILERIEVNLMTGQDIHTQHLIAVQKAIAEIAPILQHQQQRRSPWWAQILRGNP